MQVAALSDLASAPARPTPEQMQEAALRPYCVGYSGEHPCVFMDKLVLGQPLAVKSDQPQVLLLSQVRPVFARAKTLKGAWDALHELNLGTLVEPPKTYNTAQECARRAKQHAQHTSRTAH